MVWTDIGLKMYDLSAEDILKPLSNLRENWMRLWKILHPAWESQKRLAGDMQSYPAKNNSPIAIQFNGCVSIQRNYQTNSGPKSKLK